VPDIGAIWSGFVNSAIVQLGVRFVGLYLFVLYIAQIFWVYRDAQNRTENRILPVLAALLVAEQRRHGPRQLVAHRLPGGRLALQHGVVTGEQGCDQVSLPDHGGQRHLSRRLLQRDDEDLFVAW